jgi:RNA polymerase sigma factor (sigma-70 family)
VHPVSRSDAELAVLAGRGDVEALAGLIERHRASLYATAMALLRSRNDALDAVQETAIVALTRISSVRDPNAVGGWLQAVLRNVCLMRLRAARRDSSAEVVNHPDSGCRPEDVIEQHAHREWVWTALEQLGSDDRMTVMLRYFSRCTSYQAIATVTGVPVGTVRSRLNRARSQLCRQLRRTADGSPFSHATLERNRRVEWEHFYAQLHAAPVPRTYRDVYAADVDVTDSVGRWRGVAEWSAHEREAITLGVTATIVGLIASRDVTVLEIDFTNPESASGHCPPRSTFVHRLDAGRSQRVDIHYS